MFFLALGDGGNALLFFSIYMVKRIVTDQPTFFSLPHLLLLMMLVLNSRVLENTYQVGIGMIHAWFRPTPIGLTYRQIIQVVGVDSTRSLRAVLIKQLFRAVLVDGLFVLNNHIFQLFFRAIF